MEKREEKIFVARPVGRPHPDLTSKYAKTVFRISYRVLSYELEIFRDCSLWQELENRPLTKVFANLKKCYDENKKFEKNLVHKNPHNYFFNLWIP